MEQVIILGSASAVPSKGHENTHLLVQAGERTVLVDCPGNPVVRLQEAGLDINLVTDIILTHFHPDHVAGFAPLLMSMWLVGRKQPINVYGLAQTLERAEKMMGLYEWKMWPGFFQVNFNIVEAEEHSPVMQCPELRIFSSAVQHLIPTIGLRFEFLSSNKSVAYSCDTEQSQIVRRLAAGADILIHESTGSSKGHSSPEEAGEIATQAEAGSLYLIHYPPELVEPASLVERASQTFSRPVYVTYDLQVIPIQ